MEIILDADGEDLVRDAHFDIAVPVHVETFHGETKIFAYPSVKSLCEDYAAAFANDLYGDAAIRYLQDGCAAFCSPLGYAPDRYCAVVGYNFLAPSGLTAEEDFCKRIRRAGKYENLTTFDLSACLAAERVIFAVVRDGAIVSLAVTCEAPTFGAFGEGGDRIEISVETAPDYRGHGYATACVRALAAFLAANGHGTLYKCRKENVASARVARGAGLVQTGNFAYFVYRKNG